MGGVNSFTVNSEQLKRKKAGSSPFPPSSSFPTYDLLLLSFGCLEELGQLGETGAAGVVGGSQALEVFEERFGACLEQDLHRQALALTCQQHQRALALAVAGVGIGLVLQQQLEQRGLVAIVEDQRPDATRGRIVLGSYQLARALAGAAEGGQQQGCIGFLIAPVRTRARREQGRDRLLMPPEGGPHQGRIADLVNGIELFADGGMTQV